MRVGAVELLWREKEKFASGESVGERGDMSNNRSGIGWDLFGERGGGSVVILRAGIGMGADGVCKEVVRKGG